MKTLDKIKFAERISGINEVAMLVKCVDSLPDISTVADGTTVQLLQTQAGFIATHIYVKRGGAWNDITEDQTITEDPAVSAEVQLVLIDDRARLQANWQTPSDRTSDKWVRDLLVTKQDDYPSSPSDGELIVGSIVPNQYKDHVYLSRFLNFAEGAFKYRVFHIYSSGYTTYTNATIVE